MAEWKKIIVSGSSAELSALNVDGTVTANAFSGDGSNLTNVPAGSVDIESFTDGTGITVAATDKLIISDAGTEKYINVSQLPFTTANVSTNLSEGTTTTTTVDVNSSDGTNATLAEASTTRAGVLSSAKWDEIVANTKKVSDVNHNVTTNLSEGTATNTTVDVNSSDGTNATLASASTTRAGLLSKAKFDEIVANTLKTSNVTTNLSTTLSATAVSIDSSDGTNASIGAATTTNAGIMTKAIYDEHVNNTKKASNVTTDLSTTLSATAVKINSSDGTDASICAATTTNAGIMTKAMFDEHTANNLKVSNTDVDVSIANLKTRLAGGFGSNAVQIGDSTDVVTIGNKLVVTGDLVVSGTTTTVDTANLNVTDQFINLNDGGSAADGGIVIEGASTSFGWDNSASRWAFDFTGATEGQTTIASDAFAVSVHTTTGDDGKFTPDTNYEKNGNIFIFKDQIYMYVE
jgi:hypothetical protein